MRSKHFCGVNASIDPDHRLALVCERPRLIIRQTLCMSQAFRNFFISGEFLLVLRRSDNGEIHCAVFG